MQHKQMRKLLGGINHQWLGLLCVAGVLVGMLFSRVLMSIGMIGLLVNALINADLKSNFRRFIENKALLGLTGIFLLYLFSGLNSENFEFWVERLRIKLPFLILPFAILAIPRFPASVYYRLLYAFFWLIGGLCLFSLAQFLLDYEAITYGYRAGKVMPTAVMHIRFSLMTAYCVAIGWHLFQKGFYLWSPQERYWTLGASVFMAAYLHVLAVRSGLLALYGVLAFFLVREVVRRRKYALGLGIALLLAGTAYLSYRFIPTLKNKVNYTLYNLHLFERKQDLYQLSDSYRLGSIEAGVEVGNRHFWTGVGVGDVRTEVDQYFIARYPSLVGLDLMPHNQYVFVYMATGILGLLYFLWATSFPLYFRKAYRDPLFVAFHIILFLSFLVEHTIETQLGTALYLLFLLLGIRYGEEEYRRTQKRNR